MRFITFRFERLRDEQSVLYAQCGNGLSLQCLGPSAGEVRTGAAQETAYSVATQQAATEFGDSSKAFNDLMTSMAPIAAAGPGQMGWSAAQSNAVNSQTINQTAAQYKNASAAVQNQIGAEGGGNIALPTGANIATEEGLAEAGAQQESAALSANTIANAEQGNANWKFAEGGIQSAPGVFGTANSATTAGTSAGAASSQTQNNITNAQNSWEQLAVAAISGASKMGAAALTGGASLAMPAIGGALFSAAGGGAGAGSSSGAPVDSSPLPDTIS
jgi:hypothetical protein